MHCDYADIRDSLGKPDWFDECAVPRYCKFHPKHLADIYANQVALLEIMCQGCGHRFLVAVSSGSFESLDIKTRIKARAIGYGDPPNVRCCAAGPTMSSIPLRVVRFWKRNKNFKWKRKKFLEVRVEDE